MYAQVVHLLGHVVLSLRSVLLILLPSLLSTGIADVYRCVLPHSAFPCAAKDSNSQGTAFHLASRGFTLVIVLGKNLNLFRLWAQSPVPQSK